MSQHFEVRILPNGHPMIYMPNVPPFPPPATSQLQPPQVPVVPPTPPLPQSLPPQTLSTQIAPVPHPNIIVPRLVPIEQLLNPNGLPLPQPVVQGGANQLLEMLHVQYQMLAPGLNPFISPLGIPMMQIAHNHPPPLMSLRVPTPPAMRMHPYQREAMQRRQRQRTNSYHAPSRNENIVAPAVHYRLPTELAQESRPSAIRHTSHLDTQELAHHRN